MPASKALSWAFGCCFMLIALSSAGKSLLPKALAADTPGRFLAPKRIVSGVLAADEVLCEIALPATLAGVSAAVDNPAISRVKLNSDAVRHQGSIEELIRLQPDLLIVASYSRAETLSLLSSLKIPVLRLKRFSSLSEIESNILRIGEAIGREEQAVKLVAGMQQRISRLSSLTQNLSKTHVLYYSEGGVTAGADTVINELIELAGGVNVAKEAGLKGDIEIPLETILSLMPEVIILPGWRREKESDLKAEILGDSRFKLLPAVSRGRIYTLPSSALTSLSHHALDGAELLAAILHPEIQSSP